MNLDQHHTPCTKSNKMGYRHKCKIRKLLEENRGKNICDLGLGKKFLVGQQSTICKRKILCYMQLMNH